LNLDDRLGLLEAVRQPRVLAPQAFQFLTLGGVGQRFAAALLRSERVQRPGVTLFTPSHQVGRIKSFPTQQLTELAARLAAFRLGQNPQLVLRIEPPPARFLWHLGRTHGVTSLLLIPPVLSIHHEQPPGPLQ
jgi:hypothetical protein